MSTFATPVLATERGRAADPLQDGRCHPPRSIKAFDENSGQNVLINIDRYISHTLSSVGQGSIYYQDSDFKKSGLTIKFFDSRFISGMQHKDEQGNLAATDTSSASGWQFGRSQSQNTLWTAARSRSLLAAIEDPNCEQYIMKLCKRFNHHISATTQESQEKDLNAYRKFYNIAINGIAFNGKVADLRTTYDRPASPPHSVVPKISELPTTRVHWNEELIEGRLEYETAAKSSNDGHPSGVALADADDGLLEQHFRSQGSGSHTSSSTVPSVFSLPETSFSSSLDSKKDTVVFSTISSRPERNKDRGKLELMNRLSPPIAQPNLATAAAVQSPIQTSQNILRHELPFSMQMQQMFWQEFHTYQNLQHLQNVYIPRLVSCLSTSLVDLTSPVREPILRSIQIHTLVLNTVQGITLESYLRNFKGTKLPPALIRSLWAGLHCFANFEFFHPDLKPRNIIVRSSGKTRSDFRVTYVDLESTSENWWSYDERRRGRFPSSLPCSPEMELISSIEILNDEHQIGLPGSVIDQLYNSMTNRWPSRTGVEDNDIAVHIILQDLCATNDAISAVNLSALHSWLCTEATRIMRTNSSSGDPATVWAASTVETLAVLLGSDPLRAVEVFLAKLSVKNCIPTPVLQTRYAHLPAARADAQNSPSHFIFNFRRHHPIMVLLPHGKFSWPSAKAVLQS